MLKTLHVSIASRIVWKNLHISTAANIVLWDDLEFLNLLCTVYVYRKFSEGVIALNPCWERETERVMYGQIASKITFSRILTELHRSEIGLKEVGSVGAFVWFEGMDKFAGPHLISSSAEEEGMIEYIFEEPDTRRLQTI